MDYNSGFEQYVGGVLAYQWIAGRRVVAFGIDRQEASEKLRDALALDERLQALVQEGKHLVPAEDR